MTLAVHASVGAIAGNAVSNPVVAFVIGLVSHFFLDMIPHGDEGMYEGYLEGTKVRRAIIYTGLDLAVTIVLITTFFVYQDFFEPLSVSMGIVGGLLPDFMVGLYEVIPARPGNWFYRKLGAFHAFHMKNHCLIGAFLFQRSGSDRDGKVAPRGKDKSGRQYGVRDISFRSGILLQGVTLVMLVTVIL